MTSPARRAGVVRLTELADIVHAVPHLLGFHPTESLVAVAMTGRRERLSFSMRVDLPADGDEADEVVGVCIRAMTRAGADAVLLFVYTDTIAAGGGPLPGGTLVERLLDEMPMPVRDALLVTAGRVWSYVCTDPICCPPEGRALERETPGALALAAAHALVGQSVLPSRDALVASVAPIEDDGTFDAAMNRAAERFLEVGERAFRALASELLVELTNRYAQPPATMSPEEAALLVVALHDTEFRDATVQRVLTSVDEARGLLGDLARRALPPLDAPACTLLAIATYLQGDGALAGAALDRALSSDPAYALGALLDAALRGQVSPADIRRALTGVAPRPRGRSGRRR